MDDNNYQIPEQISIDDLPDPEQISIADLNLL